MNTAGVLNSIRQITDAYRERLARVQPTKYHQTPADGGWSYSEVYAHIFDLSILSLEAIERCNSVEAKQRKTPFITRAILFLGAFPPAVKFKVPKQFESRVKKIEMKDARALIDAFASKLVVSASFVEKTDKTRKTAHPRLGYLNAEQWLRFTEIHLKHHLKQLKRIDKQDNFTSLRP